MSPKQVLLQILAILHSMATATHAGEMAAADAKITELAAQIESLDEDMAASEPSPSPQGFSLPGGEIGPAIASAAFEAPAINAPDKN